MLQGLMKISFSLAAALLSFSLIAWFDGGGTSIGISAEAGSLTVGGRRMSCGRGIAKNNPKMRSLGIAIPAKQVFFINKRLLRRYPAAFQRFVFLHECAHMYLRDERAADCWAIKRGLYRGLLSSGSVKQICKALWNTPAGLYHFAGPQRCEHLKQCFAAASKSRRGRKGRRKRR